MRPILLFFSVTFDVIQTLFSGVPMYARSCALLLSLSLFFGGCSSTHNSRISDVNSKQASYQTSDESAQQRQEKILDAMKSLPEAEAAASNGVGINIDVGDDINSGDDNNSGGDINLGDDISNSCLLFY